MTHPEATRDRPAAPAGTAPPAPAAPAAPAEERRFAQVTSRWFRKQPGLGLAGLLLVVPSALLIAAAAGGPEQSLLVLGPLVTFSLPVVAMVAFWWEDWPGSRLRKPWSGITDTLLIAVAAIPLTVLGQAIVDHADLRGVFDATPGPGHAATFPATLPIAGAAFVAMLQLTLVWEGWPLRRLPRVAGGAAALVISWIVALILYATVDTPAFGAYLILVGLWQVWIFVVWRGWPFAELDGRWARLVSGNIVVLGGAWLLYLVAHTLAGIGFPVLEATAGMVIAAGLVVGMLFEGWARQYMTPPWERVTVLAATLALAASLYAITAAIADTIDFTRVEAEEWINHVGLNAIGIAVISHVAIGRRFPFHPPIQQAAS